MPALPLFLPAAAVWRASDLGAAAGATLASGHAALDAQLPGGGWPVGAVSEILQAHSGQHEWRLLLPALRRTAPGPLVLVGAPQVPFAPGLWAQGLDARRLLWLNVEAPAARLWSAEQALRCAEVAAVLVWLTQARAEHLRRLQLAAQTHAKLLFVMRPAQAQVESSPAVLRLLLAGRPVASTVVDESNASDALWVQILKRRGPPLERPLLLPARPARLAALLAMARAQVGARPITVLRRVGEDLGDALDCTASAA